MSETRKWIALIFAVYVLFMVDDCIDTRIERQKKRDQTTWRAWHNLHPKYVIPFDEWKALKEEGLLPE